MSSTTRRTAKGGTPPRRRARPDSRDRLVSAASGFFLKGSYHSAGTAEICAVAGVNKGSFYHYFPSKTDLLLEVIEQRVLEVEEQIRRISAGRSSSERKILQLFTVPHISGANRRGDSVIPGYFLGNIILELSAGDSRVRSAAMSALQRWGTAIEEIVEQFLRDEQIHGLESKDAAAALVGLLQGGTVMANAYDDPRKLRAFGHIALTILRSSTE